jgi:uncharacterized protein (DUF983 family)
MSNLLFWVLSCGLFLVAVACVVLALLVRDHESRYPFWAALAVWAVLVVALALVLRARFL